MPIVKLVTFILGCITLTGKAMVSPGIEDLEAQSGQSNGNFAVTISKSYLESHQQLLKKIFILETRDLKLKDVRVQQKTGSVRLTSLMSEM